jgi:hypothetical protein
MKEISVRGGSNDLRWSRTFEPAKVSVHPYYQNDFEPAAFDLAVIELATQVNFTALLLPTR